MRLHPVTREQVLGLLTMGPAPISDEIAARLRVARRLARSRQLGRLRPCHQVAGSRRGCGRLRARDRPACSAASVLTEEGLTP